MSERDLDALHQLALDRFRLVALLEDAQRSRELEDLKFADPIQPSDQWSKAALDSRAKLPAQGNFPPVPERPALTINKLKQPLQQVINAERQARLSLVFAPEGEGTSLEDAAVFEDIARAIQADSRAHLARNWAFDRAVKCGRGFYRIETDYVNDRSRDQKILYKRILNQFSVYYDPYCQEPDFSDAQWCFVTEDLPWPEYVKRYGDSDLAGLTPEDLTRMAASTSASYANEEQLSATGDPLKGWVTDTNQGRMVRIAEYFFFEPTSEELLHVAMPDGSARGVYRSELTPEDVSNVVKGADGTEITRSVQRKQLLWGTLNGVEFLTDGDEDPIRERDGHYIPIVPVIADETNINGERRYTGMVRPARDSQGLFNLEASSLAEMVHLGPLAPFVGYATQFQGYEAFWSQLNSRRLPYLPVNPPQDQLEATLPLPQRQSIEQPIQAVMQSMQAAEHYVDITTGIPPAALGQLDPHERSGKAILALQNQSQLSTSGYADNLSNMSMLLEGKILRDLIPKIYDRPGRIVAAMGDDDTRKMVMLGRPFVPDEQGRPQPAQPGQDGARQIDLAAAEVSVAPTIGKSHTTRREEASDAMMSLGQAVPELVPVYADLMVKNMDFPGARQIADRLAKMVPPQAQDEDAQQKGKLEAENAQLKQQVQQMAPLADKGQLDLMKVKETEQGENQRAQLTAQTDQQKLVFQAQESQAKFQIEMRKLEVQLEIEMAKLGSAQSMARGELEQQELHQHAEHTLKREEMESDRAQADLDRQAASEQEDQQHQNRLEEGEQASQSALQLQAEKPQPQAGA